MLSVFKRTYGNCAGIIFLILLSSVQPLISAGESLNLSDLKSPDEVVKIRALWAIAQLGKASKATEADILPLLTKTWEGHRLSKWCLHALVKIGAPVDKHFDAFAASMSWAEKMPDAVEERTRTEPAWKAKTAGPELPGELKSAEETVWATALDAIFSGLERADRNNTYKYQDCIRRSRAPRELLVPRLGKVLLNSQLPSWLREAGAHTIGMLRCFAGSVEPLSKGLADPDVRVRAACVSALGSLSREVDSYGDIIWEYRHPALEQTMNTLLKLLKSDPEPAVREAAVTNLQYLGPGAKAAIPQEVEAIKTEQAASVRCRIIYSFISMNAPEGPALFIDRLSDEPRVQAAALDALEMSARRTKSYKEYAAALPTIEKLSNEATDPKIKAAAAKALKTINALKP